MRSILGGALATALLVGLTAAPAVAAAKPQPLTWSVQPATATGLDKRPSFTLSVTGGQRVVDYVAVSNYSKKALTLNLYATDAFNTEQGEFSLLPKSTKPTDVGSWVELKQTRVTVPARSKTTVPFLLDVPTGATPGDHVGGIVASLTTGATAGASGTVAIEQRAGTRIYARVLGEIDPQVTLADVSTTYESSGNPLSGGTAVVEYTARNTGNVRIVAGRTVEVAGPFGLGSTTITPKDLPELLPGEEATYTERVAGVRPFVRLTGTVTLVPVIAPVTASSAKQPAVSGSATTWAVPWVLLGVVLLLALVAGFLLRRRSRRRSPTSVGEVELREAMTPRH